MHAPKNGKSVFQHRGYTCSSCKETTQVYGRDPSPGHCLTCGAIGTLTIAWNHIVTSTQSIVDTDVTWDEPRVSSK